MDIRAQIAQTGTWFYVRRALGRLDWIQSVRWRHKDFDQVRDRIRSSGTDNMGHFGNGYTHEGGLYLQQNPDEFAALTVFLRERGPYANYVEIGSASGGACLFLYREVGFQNVFSLDDGQHPRAVAQPGHFAPLESFKQFVGDSHTEAARSFLKQNVSGKLDLAFIDGDHSYEGVWQDLELVRGFCRPGTLIIFHDTIACDGVQKAWLRSRDEKIIKPLAEFIGDEKPLGIGVGSII